MMIKFEKAYQLILNNTNRLGMMNLSLDESIGYVLAQDIKAGYNIPPFNKSAMDGYALRCEDVKSPSQTLKCVGVIKGGTVYKKALTRNQCVKIMTGSPLPEGADCVVMVESTQPDKKSEWVKVLQPVKSGENVCFKGEDIKKGTVILKKGTVMRAPEVSIAASLGKDRVRVYKKPTVAILNTGDEIIEPGRRLSFGKIYNSNGPMLRALLRNLDIKFKYLGIAQDKEEDLKRLILEGLKADIFLLSGGVSMGDYDLVPKVLEKCGVRKVFHKIFMKPGKPVFFGTKQNRLIFGIPGNPVSTYLVFITLIKPAIDKMMGKDSELNIKKAKLGQDFKQRPGRKHFIPAKIKPNKGQLYVYPVKSYHGSADIASLSKADGFMIVDGRISFLNQNSQVEVIEW